MITETVLFIGIWIVSRLWCGEFECVSFNKNRKTVLFHLESLAAASIAAILVYIRNENHMHGLLPLFGVPQAKNRSAHVTNAV